MNIKPEKDLKKELKARKRNERVRTDTLLRETSTNYIRMIGDTDRKARIMVVVNSIFLTISITLLTKSLDDYKYVWISAVILMIANVLTLYFSIQSVKPEFRKFKNSDSENSIIFYKKCNELSLQEYSSQLLETMNDNDKKLDALVKELYHYGNLLSMKYKLLNIAYHIFSWGILLAILSYLYILLFIIK
jgi:hypothetical protein